jgi:hypothetical protein
VAYLGREPKKVPLELLPPKPVLVRGRGSQVDKLRLGAYQGSRGFICAVRAFTCKGKGQDVGQQLPMTLPAAFIYMAHRK